MLYPQLSSKRIILASKSPRRLELVRGLEIEPEVVIREVDESFPSSVKGPAVAEFVTLAKAQAFNDILTKDDVIITGDTVVLLGNDVLEKPKDRAEAITMLKRLSGNTHTVASGVAITTLQEGTRCMVDTCEVEFNNLSDQTIEHYLDHYKPYDKAGSYGVQDLIGYVGVKSLKGSFYTVMGLPVHLLHEMLSDIK